MCLEHGCCRSRWADMENQHDYAALLVEPSLVPDPQRVGAIVLLDLKY